MAETRGRFRRLYGAAPVHLLFLLGCFALAGYAAALIAHFAQAPRIAVWFAAAVIVHDLVLFPAYTLADRSLDGLLRGRRRAPRGSAAVSPRNYLRVPTLGSALLLVVFLPGIIRQGAGSYLAATGQTQAPFLTRWLLLSATLFALSALLYGTQVIRSTLAHRPARRPRGENRLAR